MRRRAFLRELWKAGAALLGAAAAMPAAWFWGRSPRPKSGEDDPWADLGSVRNIPEAAWVGVTFDLERRNRWRRESVREKVYLKRQGDDFQVLSSTCPHTGCLVRQAEDGFTCPCHRSFFDDSGRSIQGPSPRDMDPLEWKVEKRRLKVYYQRFRPGIADRKAVAG